VPFKKGMAKVGGSGRKQGVSKAASVRAICEEEGCDPIAGMARLALDPKSKPELRGRMFAELAQYVWPRLQAIQHTGPGGGPIEHNVSASELLLSRISGIAAKAPVGSGDPQLDE
jgi:hypothetical protein